MPTTHHFQLSYSVKPLDQSAGALLAADRVREKLSSGSVEGWRIVEGVPGVVTGHLQLKSCSGPVGRQEAQASLEQAFSGILRSQEASFDVIVNALAMVDQLGPAMSLEI